jgi:GNAT superfamily N-acetyltransferase
MKDIARIHRLGVETELAQLGKELHSKYSLSWFKSVWEQQSCEIKTHTINDSVVGFMADYDNRSMIYVDPEYHRQGIGSKLLGDTKEVWVLDGNKIAEGFYKKNGFHKTYSTSKHIMFEHEVETNLWLKGGRS